MKSKSLDEIFLPHSDANSTNAIYDPAVLNVCFQNCRKIDTLDGGKLALNILINRLRKSEYTREQLIKQIEIEVMPELIRFCAPTDAEMKEANDIYQNFKQWKRTIVKTINNIPDEHEEI